MLDIDLKTTLKCVDAAAEVEPLLNENNSKSSWYLK